MISEVNDALERGSAYSLEYRVIHLSGETRWVAEHGRPVFGPDGRPQWTAGRDPGHHPPEGRRGSPASSSSASFATSPCTTR